MRYLFTIILTLIIGCSTTKNKPPLIQSLQTNDEFERQLEIKEVLTVSKNENKSEVDKTTSPVIKEIEKDKSPKKSISKFTNKHSNNKKNNTVIDKTNNITPTEKPIMTTNPIQRAQLRLPLFESNSGFDPGSRRPQKDPFRINEKVVLECSYMGATVGHLTLEVLPFIQVNKRKSYHWVGRIRTNDFFSSIFLVDDSMEVMSDFETLVPTAYRLHVKEEKQLKESRALYNTETNEATYWEKKWTEKDGHKDKKQKWIMEPYSQNYFSTLFYMRVFKYEVGKEYMFMLSENEKNTRYKNIVIRKEKLETPIGILNTIVLKPQIEADGAYKPVGDSYIWITDDERKLVVKIEAALKFGTLVFDLKTIDYGTP